MVGLPGFLILILFLFRPESVSFKGVVVVQGGGGYFASLRAEASNCESLFASPERFQPKKTKTGVLPEFGINYIRGAPLHQTDR